MDARICAVDNCGRSGKITRGMCAKHYRYWIDHTPPEQRGPAPRELRRFESFVSRRHANGCWVWTGPRNRQGYGFWGKMLAHRHAWQLANGPIPEGLWILHHCDNKPCVNPAHLYAGTRVENTLDAHDRDRFYHPFKTHCPRGHEKTGDNLLVLHTKEGIRHRCRVCELARKRESERRRQARLKAAQRGDHRVP